MKRSRVISLLFPLVLSLPTAATSVCADDRMAFAALQIAYAREMNAQIQYLVFAERAENEGLPEVALLFHVAARAESIHASKEAVAIIQQFDGVPRYDPTEVFPLGTADNLRRSIEGEKYERGEIYPLLEGFMRRAHDYESLAACRYARNAEATHVEAFRLVLSGLEEEALEPYAAGGLVPVVFATRHVPDRWILCLGDGSIFAHRVGHCPNCGAGENRMIEVTCQP